jgi:uroporphyrin-III C-methyltransferase
MSEQIPQQQNGPDVPSRNSQRGLFARVSLTQMTLAVLVLIFLWQWLDGHRAINDMQQQLAAKIAEMDGNSKANQMMLAQNQAQVRELFAKVAMLEARFAETQSQRTALEALYNDLSVNRDETALAEVEQLLLLAEQQLQLTANVKAALIAMQSADGRLKRADRPALNGLRKVIGRDMDKLRALPGVDVGGISVQLNKLITDVDELPLAYQQRVAREPSAPTAAPVNETAWQKLLREIWEEAKQLVRIENTGKAEIPLLTGDQEFLLRENLKIRLLTARLALLSRDQNSYRQELKTAQLWISRYFDERSNQGAQMSDELKKLAAYDIKVEMPDIGDSLQAVRNYRLTHEYEPGPGSKRRSRSDR